MTTLWPGILLTALCLLALATLASAEGAWVAWLHSVFPSKGIDEWTPPGAAETLEDCKQGAATAAGNSVRKLRAQNDRGTLVQLTGRAVIELTYSFGDSASLAFVCLPDTVDPRGPKGK